MTTQEDSKPQTPHPSLSCLERLLILLSLLMPSDPSQAQDWEYLGLFGSHHITGIAVHDPDTIFVSTPREFGSTPGYIFRTCDGGQQWDTLSISPSVWDLKMHPRNSKILYAGLGSFDPPYGILKTTDGGENWFHADSGMIVDSEHLVQVIEFDSQFPETLYAGTSGPLGGDIYKTTDAGGTWTSIGTSLNSGVVCIAVDPFSTGTVYAGTQYAGLYKSDDGGNTWVQSLVTNVGVFGIGIDPVDIDILHAGVGSAGSGYYRSTNGGESWVPSTVGLPTNTSGAWIEVNQESRDIFIVVFPDSVGLFKSTDLGISWERMEGLTSETWATEIALSPDQMQLYVGFDNVGVYRTTFVTSTSEGQTFDGEDNLLLQNYPNPFNAMTLIRFEIFRADEIKLSICDALGQEVAILVKGKLSPGSYELPFDGRALPSGVYFSRLSTRFSGNQSSKLILLR